MLIAIHTTESIIDTQIISFQLNSEYGNIIRYRYVIKNKRDVNLMYKPQTSSF